MRTDCATAMVAALLVWGCSSSTTASEPTDTDRTFDEQVHVAADAFWMGCNDLVDSECESDELPQHKVQLSAFWIDAYEVTVARYRACVEAGACSEPKPILGACNWGVEGRDHHPINCVDHHEATAFCSWSHADGRLPTEAEWEMAARGGCGGRSDDDCRAAMPVFPWGNADSSCAYAVMDDGSGPGCGSGSTAPVGSVEAGVSPVGVYDLSGNVWEWMSDHYDAEYYSVSPSQDPRGPGDGDLRTVRGGRFGGPSYILASLRSSNRDIGSPEFYFDGLGVRCARSE